MTVRGATEVNRAGERSVAKIYPSLFTASRGVRVTVPP